jgi:transcriptional regulator with XRE-family HTH domain
MTGSKKAKGKEQVPVPPGPVRDYKNETNQTGYEIPGPGEKQLYSEIGLRVQAIRKQLDYKQKDFAVTLGISNASLSSIEAGNAMPRFELIYNIIKVHHVNIRYVLFGEGEMFMIDSDPLAEKFEIEFTAEYRAFFRELIFYFNKSQLARSGVLNKVRQYIIDNKETILKEIRISEAEIPDFTKEEKVFPVKKGIKPLESSNPNDLKKENKPVKRSKSK